MKRFALILLLLIPVYVFPQNAGIENNIVKSELVLFFPTFASLNTTLKSLMKRFYGKNYAQMEKQYSLNSEASLGVDILDAKSLEGIGVDTAGPLAYVHVSNNYGYIVVTVKSEAKFKAYTKNILQDTVPSAIIGKYAILSENPDITPNLKAALLTADEGFKISAAKLNFKWDKPFVWIDSKYLSAMSGGTMIPANVSIPYGFTAAVIDFAPDKIKLDLYSALMSDKQSGFMKQIRIVNGKGKFDILDYGWGSPVVVGNVYMNFAELYRYYIAIDQLNVLGLKGIAADLMKKYNISIEKELIANTDGRFKLVILKYDDLKKQYLIYGSIGIKDTKLSVSFMENLKAMILKSGQKLYLFDIFTYPFYHYQTENFSIYYGQVENDFFFSTDKDLLITIVKNVFDNKNGYYKNLPAFFTQASQQTKVGYFFTIDVQSLFSSVNSSGMKFTSDFLTGIKDIYVFGNPDMDENPHGWNTTVEINFYK
ncbi:MAG: hypothetical protein A2Y33_07735 [Spirochaetes bacterium GWF1_51_8]|nr:MAG: hypothetical protein A2Y33_07735 [Spirochaetes bacterium GWF1_51_8]